jgi:hypothetical protein
VCCDFYYTPVPFDVVFREPLQNLLHRPGFVLLSMGVVTIKNSVTCKTPSTNRLVAMLAPGEYYRGATLATYHKLRNLKITD